MVVFIYPLGIIICSGKLCAYFQESQFASRKVFVQLKKKLVLSTVKGTDALPKIPVKLC